MKAYVFPGQGAQFVGMGKELYNSSPLAKELFEKANNIVGYRISDLMFGGTEEQLRQTIITQPVVFLHSTIECMVAMANGLPVPDMMAGHSLGEYSALVASGALSFEDGLRLVVKRAEAMQRACELQPSTMAIILRADDNLVDEICTSITDEIIVAANFNCPGQVVISGSVDGVEKAVAKLNEQGIKRVLPLNVGGAFHSPLMQPAADDLKKAIMATVFNTPRCPVYQNVNAYPQTNPEKIQQNLVAQLTAPVRWTQTIKNMINNGADNFLEFGPGQVLTGLIGRIDKNVVATVYHED